MVVASCEVLLFYNIGFENPLQNYVNTLAANRVVPVVEERRHASDVASILRLCVFSITSDKCNSNVDDPCGVC